MVCRGLCCVPRCKSATVCSSVEDGPKDGDARGDRKLMHPQTTDSNACNVKSLWLFVAMPSEAIPNAQAWILKVDFHCHLSCLTISPPLPSDSGR